MPDITLSGDDRTKLIKWMDAVGSTLQAIANALESTANTLENMNQRISKLETKNQDE